MLAGRRQAAVTREAGGRAAGERGTPATRAGAAGRPGQTRLRDRPRSAPVSRRISSRTIAPMMEPMIPVVWMW